MPLIMNSFGKWQLFPASIVDFQRNFQKQRCMEIQKFVQSTIAKYSESHWYIHFTLIVGVKIVDWSDLADWKHKICLIIVLKQVEERYRNLK